jgi:uncharacterized protein
MAMEMDHSFTVPVSPDRAWDVLLDVERIAPCMPGATVDEFDGEVVTGRIKVKVGPVSLTYRGTAKFTERDADARRIVLEAAGKETRGAGTASATVQASLAADPDGQATTVSMHTTMNVTGRPAQFGRGVIAEVGGKLVEQFAQNLRQQIADGGAAPSATAASATAAGDAAPAETEAAPAGAGVAEAAAAETGAGTAAEAGTTAGDGTGSATADDGTAADATAVPDSAPSGERTTGITPSSTPPAPSTAYAPPAATNSEDSINLIRLVGPAILKRVVPVAAGLAALALLGRRFRHVFRRGTKKQGRLS